MPCQFGSRYTLHRLHVRFGPAPSRTGLIHSGQSEVPTDSSSTSRVHITVLYSRWNVAEEQYWKIQSIKSINCASVSCLRRSGTHCKFPYKNRHQLQRSRNVTDQFTPFKTTNQHWSALTIAQPAKMVRKEAKWGRARSRRLRRIAIWSQRSSGADHGFYNRHDNISTSRLIY